MHRIPENVKDAARLGIRLMEGGFEGGTNTGWNRAFQLANDETIPVRDLAVMRAWFARHGPDAANGGTSYRGYRLWISEGRPAIPKTSGQARRYRGAVAWLIWGGDAAYLWLKSTPIRKALKEAFPERKEASTKNRLKSK